MQALAIDVQLFCTASVFAGKVQNLVNAVSAVRTLPKYVEDFFLLRRVADYSVESCIHEITVPDTLAHPFLDFMGVER